MSDTHALLERPAFARHDLTGADWASKQQKSSAPPDQIAPPNLNGLTFAQAFEDWNRAHLQQRKDGGESVRRSMLKDVLPWLGHQPIAELRRDDISAVLQRIVERGSSSQAGCVLADIRQLLRWALRDGLIDDDPSASLHKNDFISGGTVRSRALTPEEVSELARKMTASGLATHIRTAVWLMLATGARIGEVASARWQDIDQNTRTWTVPSHLSHSGHAHSIPLSDFALRHLRSADGHRRSPTWVFPSRDDSEPLSPKALGKQIRDRQRGTQIRGRSAATTMLLLSGGAWTPLDLRRTTASLMSMMGIHHAVISACLDQALRGVTAQLPVAEGAADCRLAFARLGDYLQRVEYGQPAAEQLAA